MLGRYDKQNGKHTMNDYTTAKDLTTSKVIAKKLRGKPSLVDIYLYGELICCGVEPRILYVKAAELGKQRGAFMVLIHGERYDATR